MTAQLGPGWRTDLAVLALGGSQIETLVDHLVVRTPANPTYHWGNFVLVTDPAAVNDAGRWRSVFAEAFAQARHVAIGLAAEPDPSCWDDLEVEASDVLVATGDLLERPLPTGYTVRAVRSTTDWAASTALNDEHYPGEAEFARLRTENRARMVEAGDLTWLGAFTAEDDRLAAELGIVLVDRDLARYQSVLTHADHRRRGLTGHLLGVAAEHARSAGARTLVIIADADSAAGRLYRAAGFELAETAWQVYRKPG